MECVTSSVVQLSWIERKMAATLFASPPTASLPEAITHFLQAERLKPDGWKENRLFIAKCFIGNSYFFNPLPICFSPFYQNYQKAFLCCLYIHYHHIFAGEGDYTQAVIWLDKADSIPLASADVREGIKVSRVCSGRSCFANKTLTSTSFSVYTQMLMVCWILFCPE